MSPAIRTHKKQICKDDPMPPGIAPPTQIRALAEKPMQSSIYTKPITEASIIKSFDNGKKKGLIEGIQLALHRLTFLALNANKNQITIQLEGLLAELEEESKR